ATIVWLHFVQRGAITTPIGARLTHMVLPVDFFAVIAAGVNALRVAESRLREAANKADPQLLLSLRDVESLAGRLRSNSSYEWEQGWAQVLFSPRDLGVLDDLASSYQDAP